MTLELIDSDLGLIWASAEPSERAAAGKDVAKNVASGKSLSYDL